MRIRQLAEQFNVTRLALLAIAAAVAFGALTAQKSARINGAVQRDEFNDSTAAVRRALDNHVADERAHHANTDSIIRQQQTALAQTLARIEARDCEQQGYPSPWCDNVPRRRPMPSTTQAGQPRGTP